jgi:hypothetical protein
MFMSTLDFKVTDLDFPLGSKNKTATLITGETDAFLIDTGFPRASGRGRGRSRGAEPLSEPLAGRSPRRCLRADRTTPPPVPGDPP